MEVLTIGKSKMKIVLGADEASEYGLSSSEEYKETPESRRKLWQILLKAREKQGIDPTGDKVLIQFYPSGFGELELFVTKLNLLPISSQGYVTASDRVTLFGRKRAYYGFECRELLEEAINSLEHHIPKNCLEASAYRGEYGYALELYEYTRGEENEFLNLTELGERMPRETEYYLGEYFEKIYSIEMKNEGTNNTDGKKEEADSSNIKKEKPNSSINKNKM